MTLAVLGALGWFALRWKRKKTAGEAQAPADPEHISPRPMMMSEPSGAP